MIRSRHTFAAIAATLTIGSMACDKEPEPEPEAETAAQTNQQQDERQNAEHPHAAHEHMKHKVLPSDEIQEGASIYQLDVDLVAQDGEARTWDDVRGDPVITSMVYSSCTTACPLIVGEIKAIMKKADAPDHRVLLFSMDPERDTPEALAEMKKRHDLGDNWTLVRPSESDVREVAAALGIRYRQLPSGDFNHSQVISLLDDDGVIVARAEGLGPQRSDVVKAIRAE